MTVLLKVQPKIQSRGNICQFALLSDEPYTALGRATSAGATVNRLQWPASVQCCQHALGPTGSERRSPTTPPKRQPVTLERPYVYMPFFGIYVAAV
jgi:hypothetical protein